MTNLQNVYDRTPHFLQNGLVSLSGAIKARQRYGRAYREHRAWLKDFDTWSLDHMLDHQEKSLRKFIDFAFNNSKYYQNLYRGRHVDSIRSPDDLGMLPILEKEDLQSHLGDVYTVGRHRAVQARTGGTTGKPLAVRYTYEDQMHRMAMLDHFKSRHGFENRKMRKATFSGKHIVAPSHKTKKFWRYNAPAKQMLYSTFDMSEENLARYVSHLNEYRPAALEGFFTSMSDLASFIERNDISLKFRPIAIFPTAESVTVRGRAQLERVFGAKVYDQYSSSEGAPFITECRAGSLHVELSTGIFESLPGSNEVLITCFHTHGTPLVRYRIGDSVRFGQGRQCICGSPSPQAISIEGRSSDHLLRADGVKVHGPHVANLFKNLPASLVQAQAVQKAIGEVDIYLVVDRDSNTDEIEGQLRREFFHAFDSKTEVRIHRVVGISREASGKQRLVRNLVE